MDDWDDEDDFWLGWVEDDDCWYCGEPPGWCVCYLEDEET